MEAVISSTDYDKIADAFADAADHMPGNKYYERPATIALLPPLEGLDVLDAGCGSGFYTELAHRAGARVVAFDPSAEMVKHAKMRVNNECEIHACTSAKLLEKLKGRKFDLILSNLVLHYVKDLNTEFPVLADMLKPSGQMIVSMKHPFLHDQFIKKHGYRAKGEVKLNWDVATMTHIQRPLSDITDALYSAGLVIERIIEPFPQSEMVQFEPRQYKFAMRHIPFFIQFILRRRPADW
jgi:2-polyprenyl-3-methyl-5-hydroxy-6-metoxy-1,4-benzoquinol methylase